MQNTCAECDRLWEEYTQAARAHLTVVAQRHKAAIQNAAINTLQGLSMTLRRWNTIWRRRN